MDIDYSQFARGFIPRDYSRHPLYSMSFATQMSVKPFPRSEWADRLNEKKKAKSLLSQLCDHHGIKCLNQGQLGYCHAFSPTYAAMAVRASQRLPFVELSASSIGGPVTGFRNQGAYIFDDLKQATEFGFCDTAHYPMLTTEAKYWTDEAKKNAALHKFTQWWDLENRNFDQVATCLLMGFPVCVGLNWMGHAMTYLDLVDMGGGKFGVLIQNSWGNGGGGTDDHGRYTWPEGYGKNHSTPDEAYCPYYQTSTLAA